YRPRPPPAPAGDVIAVFPFAVRGSDKSVGYLAEGMVDMVAPLLQGPTTHAVDPNLLLAAVKREGWSQDPKAGRELAERLGARIYVLGSVIEAGPRLRIQASIYNASAENIPVREVR